MEMKVTPEWLKEKIEHTGPESCEAGGREFPRVSYCGSILGCPLVWMCEYSVSERRFFKTEKEAEQHRVNLKS